MANYLYVDNSNVWIEGMHVSAVVKHLAPDVFLAQENKICDSAWRIDYGRLLEFAGGARSDIGRAVLYGSKPPEDDTLWNAIKRKGFEVITHDRSYFSRKEKKIDTNIATDIIYDALKLMDMNNDEITLIAGDKDYVPVVEKLKKEGFKFYVCFWDHAATELKSVATEFISLNAHLDYLCLKCKT